MIATVHLADLPAGGTIRSVVGRSSLADVPGMAWGSTVLVLPLAAKGPPGLRRAGLIAFWDDEDAIDTFVDGHPTGRRLAGGFHARLRPLRAFGSWPGLPAEVPGTRAVPHEGPVVVLTLGRLRMTQAVRFMRTSRPAEKAVVADEGMIWGTAAARPPFVATISMWRSSQAAAAYAYGKQRPAHSDAIAEQERKDFHKRSAFIRFAPTRVEGALGAKNPLPAAAIAV